MKKFVKWTLIIVAGLAVILFGLFKFMQYQTKKASPEEVVEYSGNNKKITVVYNRPSKKGRTIFGGLVAYDKVWRTGANEATTFTTEQDLQIDGKSLPSGKYTLWTIPGKDEWTVIFNKKDYGWGVNFDGEASRDPQADVLQVTSSVQNLDKSVELFTISFEESPSLKMSLAWDQTKVSVPIQ